MLNEERLVPVGSILFLTDESVHPALSFPGTTWKLLKNELYIVAEGHVSLDQDGKPKGLFHDVFAWKRLS